MLIDFLFDLSQPLPSNGCVADTIAHIEQMDETEVAFALYVMVDTQDKDAVIISLTAFETCDN